MAWTKRQFVQKALSSVGLASYNFDIQPEQEEDILSTLDSMMAYWNALGIRIGYPLPSSQGSSDIADDTNVPDSANTAIYTNLAIAIAPMFGKTVSQELKGLAKATYNTLLSLAAYPSGLRQQMPATMPSGAGNKTWSINQPFVTPPVEPLLAGQDGAINFNYDLNQDANN